MGVGSVLVVCGKGEMAQNIASMMIQEGFYPVNITESGNEARRFLISTPPQLIIVSTPLPDEYGTEFVFDAHERSSAGIIVLAKKEHVEDMQYSLERTDALIVPKPVNRLTLLQMARFAVSIHSSMALLKSERDNLQKRIAESKIIERAKWVLVEQHKMSESEAHRLIQKRAMDLRLTQVKIAEKIIKKHDIP